MHTSVFDPTWNQTRRKPRFARLRAALQRWLGIANLDEMHEQILGLQADVRANDANDDLLIGQIADLAMRVSRMDREQHMYRDEARAKHRTFSETLELLRLATGGIWKTADGDVMMMRQMSDNHLQNAIDWPSASVAQKALLRREQIRRIGDDRWHERYGKTSPRKLLARVSDVLRQAQLRIERLEAIIRQPLVGRLPNGNPTIEVQKPAKKAKRKS